MKDIESLIREVCNCIYTVSNTLRTGFLESVYQNALYVELQSRNIPVRKEVPISVLYHGVEVGYFKADLIVEDCLIIELKVADELSKAHEYQLVNYLTATGIDHGLLVNFKGPKIEIKRKFRVYSPYIKGDD